MNELNLSRQPESRQRFLDELFLPERPLLFQLASSFLFPRRKLYAEIDFLIPGR